MKRLLVFSAFISFLSCPQNVLAQPIEEVIDDTTTAHYTNRCNHTKPSVPEIKEQINSIGFFTSVSVAPVAMHITQLADSIDENGHHVVTFRVKINAETRSYKTAPHYANFDAFSDSDAAQTAHQIWGSPLPLDEILNSRHIKARVTGNLSGDYIETQKCNPDDNEGYKVTKITGTQNLNAHGNTWNYYHPVGTKLLNFFTFARIRHYGTFEIDEVEKLNWDNCNTLRSDWAFGMYRGTDSNKPGVVDALTAADSRIIISRMNDNTTWNCTSDSLVASEDGENITENEDVSIREISHMVNYRSITGPDANGEVKTGTYYVTNRKQELNRVTSGWSSNTSVSGNAFPQ